MLKKRGVIVKKIIIILTAIIIALSTTAIPVKAAAPEIGKDDLTLVFNPSIESVQTVGDKMTVTVNTTSIGYLYNVQVSNYADFRDAKPYYYDVVNSDKGSVAVWLTTRRDNLDVMRYCRFVWYDGKVINFRWGDPVGRGKPLTMPLSISKQIENRYRIKKTFNVPKSKYVRFRVVYYGGGARIYSRWSVKKVR